MLNIGLAQVANHYEYDRNRSAILGALDQLASKGAELALFPECAVSGYNTGLLKIDAVQLEETLVAVRERCRSLGLTAALPTPWAKGNGTYFNSVAVIRGDGSVSDVFHKSGLQRGEERLFNRADRHRRYFEVKGYRVGVVICVETAHGPWDYLQPEEHIDFIFWPGFYGATASEQEVAWADSPSASDQRVRDNLINHWRAPLALVNSATSPEPQYWPGKQFGGSTLRDPSGAEVFRAARDLEELAVVAVRPGRWPAPSVLNPYSEQYVGRPVESRT